MDLNRYKFIYRNRLCTVGANCKNNDDLLSTVSVLVFGVYDRYMIPTVFVRHEKLCYTNFSFVRYLLVWVNPHSIYNVG